MNPRHLSMLLVLLPCLGSGCVALNIPSERYDDPVQCAEPARGIDDILLWSAPQARPHQPAPADAVQDASAHPAEPPHHGKLPEVPWPRFHPVPTRPVY